MLVLCFGMQYIVSFLVLQSSRSGIESSLRFVYRLHGVMWLLLFFVASS